VTTFKLANGTELKLLPFNLVAAEAILDLTLPAEGQELSIKDELKLMVDVLVVALQRAHPDATSTWLRENLELHEVRSLYHEVMAAGGGVKAKPGEANSP
jgi:hypothetical protein